MKYKKRTFRRVKEKGSAREAVQKLKNC